MMIICFVFFILLKFYILLNVGLIMLFRDICFLCRKKVLCVKYGVEINYVIDCELIMKELICFDIYFL